MNTRIRATIIHVAFAFGVVTTCYGKQSSPVSSGVQNKTDSNDEGSSVKILRSDGSTIIGNHYWNPYFGFSIELPKGWIVAPQQEVETMQKKNVEGLTKDNAELKEKGARALAASAPPLVVVENDPKKEGFDRRGFELLVSETSGEAGPLSGEAFLKAAAQVIREQKLPAEYLGDPEKVIINGKTLWKARLRETTNGHIQCARQYVMILKKSVVQFLLVGPNDGGLNDLEPVIQSLQFSPTPN